MARSLNPTKRQIEALYDLARAQQAQQARQAEADAVIAAARRGDPRALYQARIMDMEGRRGFERVPPPDFHRELFPSGSFERAGYYDDRKPNAIITRLTEEDGHRRGRHHIITDDLLLLRDPAAAFGSRPDGAAYIMSPIGYSGRRPTNENAYTAYALTIDLDGNTYDKHLDTVHQMTKIDFLPRPTFIASSGHGLHLYYVFERPVSLIPRAQKLLQELKRRLIYRVWREDTSEKKAREYQGIVQGYRIVGTPSKLGAAYPVIAWRTGERVSLEYLTAKTIGFNPDDPRDKNPLIHDFSIFFAKPSAIAAIAPKIDKPKEPPKQYRLNPKVYEWYLCEVRSKVAAGHRYNCVMCLAVFAVKCMIDREKLERDAWALFDLLNERSDDKHGPFLEHEMRDALKIYDDPSAYRHTRKWIAGKSGFDIPANKRNGRKQKEHLKWARSARDIDHPDGSWINREGRPAGSSKQREKIMRWRVRNPDGSKADCIRATGISKPTVYRWWDSVEYEDIFSFSDNTYQAVIEDYQAHHITYELDDRDNMVFSFTSTPEQCAKDTYLSLTIVKRYWSTDAQRIWKQEDFASSYDPGYIDVRNKIIREYYATIEQA